MIATGKRSSSNAITTVLVASTVVMAVVAIGLFATLGLRVDRANMPLILFLFVDIIWSVSGSIAVPGTDVEVPGYMVPLAFALTEGSEQRAPMGQAVIGGVITSSLLTLVVVPVIYCWLDDLAAWARRGFRRLPFRSGGDGLRFDLPLGLRVGLLAGFLHHGLDLALGGW